MLGGFIARPLYLEGMTVRNIAQYLTGQGILTPAGKQQWSVSTVKSILSNEKYMGAALLQKTYTVDFLNKTMKKNEGELPQYYIENSHPAIVSPETFDLVQGEIRRRTAIRRQLNNNSPFAVKIICGECGGYYGSKVWHSTSKYRNVGWRCNRKYANSERCGTPMLREDELKAAFIAAINQVLGDKERYIGQFEEMLPMLADTFTLEAKLAEAQDTCKDISVRMRQYMEENTRLVQDQGVYDRRFREMRGEYEAAEKLAGDIRDQLLEQSLRKEKIRRYLDELRWHRDRV